MTLFLDTTALIARYIEGPDGDLVLEEMTADDLWCSSALAFTEAEMLIGRLGLDHSDTKAMKRTLLAERGRFNVVPVDDACLQLAARIGTEQPVRTIEAIHLAAASRLPKPLRYLTFDSNQIGAAIAQGFDLVSSLTTSH